MNFFAFSQESNNVRSESIQGLLCQCQWPWLTWLMSSIPSAAWRDWSCWAVDLRLAATVPDWPPAKTIKAGWKKMEVDTNKNGKEYFPRFFQLSKDCCRSSSRKRGIRKVAQVCFTSLLCQASTLSEGWKKKTSYPSTLFSLSKYTVLEYCKQDKN